MNIRYFVSPSGLPLLDQFGYTDYGMLLTNLPGLCQTPRSLSLGMIGESLAMDYSNLGPGDPQVVVAHELGHALLLGHGDGLDNDSDGKFDEYCDPTERDTEISLMSAGSMVTLTTPLQWAVVRDAALVIRGAVTASS